MKNRIKIGLFCIIGFVICCLFLQYRGQLNSNSIHKGTAISTEVDIFSGNFYGDKRTDENPWNTTAGIVTLDNGNNVVFMTPNTQYEISSGVGKRLVFDYMISNLVSASSDGAGIDIKFFDDTDEEIITESIIINPEESWKTYEKELDNNVTRILISCNDGGNSNENADWVILKQHTEYISDFGENEYVRSITYFGNEWPLNFWNSEMESIDQDFEQIKRDGFNSIILVIPWKEFQPSINPIQYNDYTFENLDKVMSSAANHGLDVYTRISYTWDYYNDEEQNSTERFLDILREENVHKAWVDYCKTMYASLSEYPNFKEGFLTWEDFWGCLAVCDNPDVSKRIIYAKDIGYHEWIKNNYKLNKYNSEFETNYKSIDSIPVPMRDDPAMESFYEFYDEYLNNILADAQDVFPNISMEVRLDADLVTDKNGEKEYYSHTKTYGCQNSDYVATMYGIPMGFENNGERVSADEALEHTEYILGNFLDQNGGKPVYVEQFLFLDNTPKFAKNAQIRKEEVGSYLEKVGDVLSKYTRGYGIWTYRDYRNNMLYNSQFGLGNSGWIIGENASVKKSIEFDSWVCTLSKGGFIAQKISLERDHFPSDEYIVEFEVKDCDDTKLKVLFGEKEKELAVTKAGTYKISFPTSGSSENVLKFVSMGGGHITIDNINLYSFIQEGCLYDYQNNEESLIKNIRTLNNKLESTR